MSLDSDLRTLTLQNAAVAAAIGNRYHNDKLPDTVQYPCVRAVTITDPLERTHSGSHGGREVVQLDVYSDAQATRNTAADAIVGWLDGYKGVMGSYDVTILVRNKPRSWEPEARLFRCMVELEILYMFRNL